MLPAERVEHVVKRVVVLTIEQFGVSETVERVAAVQVIVADGTILEHIQVAFPSDPRLTPLWGLDTALVLVWA